MSGGRFEYLNEQLKETIFSCWRGSEVPPRNVFEDFEITELVWDVLELIHDFDWYASGDTCEETWIKKKTEFKRKWLDKRGVRVKRIVDTAIDELRAELYKTYGIEGGK